MIVGGKPRQVRSCSLQLLVLRMKISSKYLKIHYKNKNLLWKIYIKICYKNHFKIFWCFSLSLRIFRPSKCTRGFYGIDPVLLDEDGSEIKENSAKGNLCIRHSWPGLTRAIHKNPDRYFETYFKNYPGFYETGDAAIRDENGILQIAGRMDDIINIGIIFYNKIKNLFDLKSQK